MAITRLRLKREVRWSESEPTYLERENIKEQRLSLLFANRICHKEVISHSFMECSEKNNSRHEKIAQKLWWYNKKL